VGLNLSKATALCGDTEESIGGEGGSCRAQMGKIVDGELPPGEFSTHPGSKALRCIQLLLTVKLSRQRSDGRGRELPRILTPGGGPSWVHPPRST
jgi:hypothetical protein